jgi:hypothetical protein
LWVRVPPALLFSDWQNVRKEEVTWKLEVEWLDYFT